MSPWIQSKKFDEDAVYIKKWVPELEDVDVTDLHKWYESHAKPEYKTIKYPKPMVILETQREKMMKMYENA
jgi:deoxyribodipyrimidine photo-lyase